MLLALSVLFAKLAFHGRCVVALQSFSEAFSRLVPIAGSNACPSRSSLQSVVQPAVQSSVCLSGPPPAQVTRASLDHPEQSNLHADTQPWLRMGRPDLPATFTRMKEVAQNAREARVAVAVCGPPAMVAEVRRLSSVFCGGGVTFDCHSEVFQL
jgi:Ferric reductase NAD binding domain